MAWLSVALIAGTDTVDALSDALLEQGALSVDVADADAGTQFEKPIFDEPGEVRSGSWSRGRVTALFLPDAPLDRAIPAACSAAGLSATTAYEVTRVDDQDWVRATQAQFGPQQITDRLWIVPSWHTPPDPDALTSCSIPVSRSAPAVIRRRDCVCAGSPKRCAAASTSSISAAAPASSRSPR